MVETVPVSTCLDKLNGLSSGADGEIVRRLSDFTYPDKVLVRDNRTESNSRDWDCAPGKVGILYTPYPGSLLGGQVMTKTHRAGESGYPEPVSGSPADSQKVLKISRDIILPAVPRNYRNEMRDQELKSVDVINAVAVTLIWWPAICLTLLNYFHFAEQHTFLAFARGLGLNHSSELTASQIFLVFSKTILFAGIILPIITFMATRFFQLSSVIKVTMVGSALLVLLNYVNLVAVAETGSLMRWDFLVESVLTAIRDPELASEYVSPESLVKLFFVLTSVGAIGLVNLYICKRRFTGWARTLIVGMLVVPAGLFPSIYLYAMMASGSDLEPGVEFVSRQVVSLFNRDGNTSSGLNGLEVTQAISSFRKMVHSPSIISEDPYKGAEAGSNLIVIAFESGPARVIDYLSNEDFRNLRLLANSSFIGKQHHSTHPYTSDALFSIFTGLYPSNLRRSLLTKTAVGLVIA